MDLRQLQTMLGGALGSPSGDEGDAVAPPSGSPTSSHTAPGPRTAPAGGSDDGASGSTSTTPAATSGSTPASGSELPAQPPAVADASSSSTPAAHQVSATQAEEGEEKGGEPSPPEDGAEEKGEGNE